MPNIGGPGENRRKLLATVMESVILYASPVWSEALKVKKFNYMVNKAQRKIALRVIRGYRTMRLDTARVLGRIIPLDLLTKEREQILLGKNPKIERKKTLEEWQKRWETLDNNLWIKLLIPDVSIWYNRRIGQIGYHLSQFFSNHGCFNSFLYRIKKKENSSCSYCGAENDTARHTFFDCENWKHQREMAEQEIKEIFYPESIVEIMIKTEKNWVTIEKWIKNVIQEKEKDERKRQPRSTFHIPSYS